MKQNAEGIILRKYYLRETSYILVIFTREFGKIRGVLKGARDPYPQFAGNFEIFTRCDVDFYRKRRKGLDLVTRCEALDFFLPIRREIERLTHACYFIELTDMVTGDHDPNGKLYDVLLEGLKLLGGSVSPKRAARIFELKFLEAAGLGVNLVSCASCAAPWKEGGRFSASGGGVLCASCATKGAGAFPISAGALNFMKKICATPLARTAGIKVSKDVGLEVERSLTEFIRFHVAGRVRSLEFLKELEREND